MVRKIAIFLLALCVGRVFADVILWQVDTSVYSGDFTAARVMVSPADGADAFTLSTLYYDEETGGYTCEFPAGVGIITDGGGTYSPPSTGEQWAYISSQVDVQTAAFFVELGNYEILDGLPSWTDTVATGEYRDYNWLTEHHAFGEGGNFDNVFWAWDGAPFSPVPEPTSGLLAAIGLVVLALRRRRINEEGK